MTRTWLAVYSTLALLAATGFFLAGWWVLGGLMVGVALLCAWWSFQFDNSHWYSTRSGFSVPIRARDHRPWERCQSPWCVMCVYRATWNPRHSRFEHMRAIKEEIQRREKAEEQSKE